MNTNKRIMNVGSIIVDLFVILLCLMNSRQKEQISLEKNK